MNAAQLNNASSKEGQCRTTYCRSKLPIIEHAHKNYDESLGVTEEPRGAFAVAATMLQQMGSFEQVLELACGTGIWTNTLLSIGKEITALDAAPEMLEINARSGGSLVIIDQYAPSDEDHLATKEEIYARRPLADGRTFTVVKVFYDLADLRGKLVHLGFEVMVHKLNDKFYFLVAKRSIL